MARAIPHRPASRPRWRVVVTSAALLAALVLVASGALAGIGATPAGAHASIDTVKPGAGAVLPSSPDKVEIWFTEGVNTNLGGVFVYDAAGNRVPTGELRHPSPEHLVVPLEGDLDDGSYIVTWRAVSEDTHPIQGTFTFHVGEPSPSGVDVERLAGSLLASQEASRSVSIGWAVARWTVFAAIALLVGGVAFGAVIWPPARDARATRRVVTAGWVGCTAATVIGAVLFGAYSRGGGLGDALDLDVLRDTLGTRFGAVWLTRLGLLVVAFFLVRTYFARRPAASNPLPQWWLPVAALVAVGIVSTPGLAGHPSTADHQTLSLVADGVHVAAMAVWLGGLVVLASAVLRRCDLDELRVVVPRFSRVALGCVVALVLTGAFQAWQLVGGLDALRGDEFGRILVVKIVCFALLLIVAVSSREIVARVFVRTPATPTAPEPPHPPAVPVVRGGALDLDEPEGLRGAGGPVEREEAVERDEATDVGEAAAGADEHDRADERELRRLRRSVWAEVALGAVVLVVTALLVNAAPPADASSRSATAAGVTIEDRQVTLDITASPGVAGLNDLHVNTYGPTGALRDVDSVEMTIALPERSIPPLSVPLRELGPGHYFSPGLDIPLAGTWRVRATVRLSAVDRVDLAGDLEIE